MAIKRCKCKHSYQDKQHGIQMRVHNRAPSKVTKGAWEYVCTVCGDRKTGADWLSRAIKRSKEVKKEAKKKAK